MILGPGAALQAKLGLGRARALTRGLVAMVSTRRTGRAAVVGVVNLYSESMLNAAQDAHLPYRLYFLKISHP